VGASCCRQIKEYLGQAIVHLDEPVSIRRYGDENNDVEVITAKAHYIAHRVIFAVPQHFC